MSSPRPFAGRRAAVSEAFSARLLDGLHGRSFTRQDLTGPNVFQSEAFLAAIEKYILSGSDRLALVGVTDSTGNPVALFPFVRRKRFGVATLEAVDFGITDYFAPAYFRDDPLSAEDTAKLWQAAVKAVPGVHAVAFKKMPRLLHGRTHALTGADFLKPMGAHATTLFLRDLSGNPTPNMDLASLARKMKKSAKVLQKHGALTFSEAATKTEADSFLKVLVAFRTARFEELGRHDALLDPKVVAFYRALAEVEEPVGRLFALRCGDEIIAVTYGFAYRNAFTLIAPAITTKKEFQSGSPGLVAMFKTLAWCQEHGFEVFDLSVGSLSYKSRFEAETVELFEHQQALSPLGLIVVAEASLRRWIRHLSLKHPGLRTVFERVRRMRWSKSGGHANA